MGRDREWGIKWGGMAGWRRKRGGKAGFENPYCGPSEGVRLNHRLSKQISR